MKKLVLSIFCLVVIGIQGFSQANIAAARIMPLGSTVTIRGVVTNGSELGLIRYVQDATGGIAAYSSSMSSVIRQDSVVVTGVLKNYNYLLEIDPVSSYQAIAPGLPLPDPKIITPNQMNETYEAQIVEIKNATFANAGGTFAGNTNYNITANGQTAQIRINNASTTLIGMTIPSGMVNLVGICSQFSYTSASAGYQLLLRDADDILAIGSINLTTPVTVSDLTNSSFKLSWTTNIAGTTEIYYGHTPSLELGHQSAAGTGTDHVISITGASASDLFYIKAYSVSAPDTGFSGIEVVVTNSASSGNIKVYFTGTVDTTVSTGTKAIQLYKAVDDTCIAYINRAKYSIDLAIYNFTMTGLSNISNALNAASNRGVVIRVVADGSTSNDGLEQLNGNIKKIARPSGDGIMHNKFMVIDCNSIDPNDPIVWTGSCNWTNNNVNLDANNILFIQDKSLAIIYKLEFEEMFGSTTATPNMSNAKFGAVKSDNTPHEITIGGKKVEIYFSPSDGTNSQLIARVNSADNDLEVATMLMTRADVGNAISARAAAGVNGEVVVSDTNYQTYNTLKTALGDRYKQYNEAGILHSKYMIVDQSNTDSDPLVWTGSHNWSSAADQKNDENTIVIHDATIANIYYQEFVQRFANAQSVGGQPILNLGPDQEKCGGLEVVLNAGNNFLTYNWSTGDIGVKTIVVDSTGIGYGTKKIWCRVTDNNGTQSDTVYIAFKDCSGINDNNNLFSDLKVYPNPSDSKIFLSFISKTTESGQVELIDARGRIVLIKDIRVNSGENNLTVNDRKMPAGIYLLRLKTTEGVNNLKVLVY